LKKFIIILIVFIICFSIWLYSPKIFDFFVYFHGITEFKDRGVFGDSFGAVTSVFSSMSFIAVLYVLYHTQQKDGEKERPFILTNINSNTVAARIIAPTDHNSFSIEIRLVMKNYSNHLAHSVKATAYIASQGKKHVSNIKDVNRPIFNSDVEMPTISFNLKTSEGKHLLDSLSGMEQVEVKIHLSYKNTSNMKFNTTNSYTIKPPPEHEPINSLRRGEYEAKYWSGGKFIACEISESEDFVS